MVQKRLTAGTLLLGILLVPLTLFSQTIESPLVWPQPFNLDAILPVRVKIYPVPFDSTVSIYSVDRRLVARLLVQGETASWDGRSSKGRRVAQGVYFYVVVLGRTVITVGRLYVKQD